MRVFVCILAVLVIGVGAYAGQFDLPDKAAQAMRDDQTGAGVGDAVIPMVGVAANNCSGLMGLGVLPGDGILYGVGGDTTGGGNDFDYDGSTHNGGNPSACSDMGSGGEDQIFEFQVAANSYWMFGTCHNGYSYAGYWAGQYWDTSVSITMNDGTCPGLEVACDGDFCGAPTWASRVEDVFLATGNTYYAIVDGWSAAQYGTYTLLFQKTGDACTGDVDCDDGLACNGAETCDLASGACLPGTSPCLVYQYCAEPAGTCTDPDPCYSLLNDDMSGWTSTGNPDCQGSWKADDIQMNTHGNSRELISYRHFHQGRDYWYDDPLGATFDVEMAIWFVRGDGSCSPWIVYEGTECTVEAQIQTTGDPSMEMLCEPNGGLPTGLNLPDSAGNTVVCEVDFFIAHRFAPSNPDWFRGQGFSIATDGIEYVGGPGVADEFGINIMFFEDCDLDGVTLGTFYASWFGDDQNIAADMGAAFVCTVPMGGCCGVGRSTGCEVLKESECDAQFGAYLGDNTMADPVGCADEDPDGDDWYGLCDNCQGDYNPDQLNCNEYEDDEGDVCDVAEEQDPDGDGYCDKDEICDADPLKQDPGQCGCGNPDTDTDYDGVADCNDLCPVHPLWALVMPGCGCESDEYDNEDDDGDGFLNCDDTCSGVDDAEFGPCDDAIPTVSEWGLVIMALLLLAAGKVYFSRRPEVG